MESELLIDLLINHKTYKTIILMLFIMEHCIKSSLRSVYTSCRFSEICEFYRMSHWILSVPITLRAFISFSFSSSEDLPHILSLDTAPGISADFCSDNSERPSFVCHGTLKCSWIVSAMSLGKTCWRFREHPCLHHQELMIRLGAREAYINFSWFKISDFAELWSWNIQGSHNWFGLENCD
jgi:hypothetical protein